MSASLERSLNNSWRRSIRRPEIHENRAMKPTTPGMILLMNPEADRNALLRISCFTTRDGRYDGGNGPVQCR